MSRSPFLQASLILVLLFISESAQSPDPSCSADTNRSIDDEIVTEGYFKHVTDDRVYILADTVILDGDDETLSYDPCKDLYVDAINVIVKGTVKWKARSVTINTVNLTVVSGAGSENDSYEAVASTSSGDDGSEDDEAAFAVATIDASYQSNAIPDYTDPAAPGESAGAAGANGKEGGTGGGGGSIDLTLSRLNGGRLALKVNGGKGGRGQAGGNGHIGADGQPNPDRDACCNGRSTQGLKGGLGGNAGNAGKSGNGGRGGSVKVRLPLWTDRGEIMSRVTMTVDGGKPGGQAKPGAPGEGGYGGAGSPTGCYNAGGWFPWTHKYRCHGGLGPDGPRGATGQGGSFAVPAVAGQTGSVRVQVGGIGKITPVTMIQLAMREGNRMYKEGKFAAARDVYMWVIDITRNATKKESIGYRKLATTYLSQISHGFDFWGHLPNNVPLNSYEDIFSHLEKDVIPYAKDVEADFNDFFDKATAQEKRVVIVRNSLQHAKYLVGLCARKRTDASTNLAHVTEELTELEATQARAQYRSDSATQLCKDAIEHYIVHKESAFSFGELFQIIRAGIQIFGSIYAGFGSLSSGIKDVIGALDAAKNIGGGFLKDLEEIGTIVKNVTYQFDKAKDALETDVTSIKNQFDKIKGLVDKTGQENDAKMLVDGQKFNQMVGKWLFLSECRDAKAAFTAYLNSSRAVNDKIMQHDSIVIQIAQLESQISKYEGLQSRLQGQMIDDYNPFTIAYALAIGEVYVNLKEAIVNEMKKMQEAYNYQFLEDRPFTYDDSRVAMIEAWLANNRIEMLDRMSQLGTEVQQFNRNLEPLENAIVIRRDDLNDEFAHLDANGQLAFTVSGAEKELAPLTHVHMTDVRVWLPGLRSSSNRVRVWLKRYGSSLVYDQHGRIRTFTHGARTMLFDYDKDGYDVNSAVSIPEVGSSTPNEYVALSPIGPWVIGVPEAYNGGDVNTSDVKEIHVQLSGTFLPCANLQCPPRQTHFHFSNETVSMTTLTPDVQSQSRRLNSVTISVGVIGVAVVGLIGIVTVVGVRRYRRRRGYNKV